MGEGPRFASVNGARVAYQVHGESAGPDIVYSPGLASHLDMTLEQPRYRRFVEALCRYRRVIRFDRRGTGISDPTPRDSLESWEIWAEDLEAVLDAAGSREASIIATNDAGGAALLFAATRPDRARALVLFNTTARFTGGLDYPEGHPPEVAPMVAAAVRTAWGTDDSVALLAPSLAVDEPFIRWYTRFQRAAISPAAMAEDIERVLRMDARHVLPEIRCPTLVLHRADYAMIPPSQARYMAAHIPDATYVEAPGGDAPIYTEGTDALVERIGTFLGGQPRPQADDRRFATVLFTDIVSSTRRAAEIGDHAWHRMLEEHDAATRAAIGAHRGRFIKSTGDGALATFDAPSHAIRCVRAMGDAMDAIGLEVRAGLHAGPVVMRYDGDVSGLAVHAAARVASKAGAGELWVSGSVASLVTDPDIAFSDQGHHELAGVPESHQLFCVQFD